MGEAGGDFTRMLSIYGHKSKYPIQQKINQKLST